MNVVRIGIDRIAGLYFQEIIDVQPGFVQRIAYLVGVRHFGKTRFDFAYLPHLTLCVGAIFDFGEPHDSMIDRFIKAGFVESKVVDRTRKTDVTKQAN
ncbi:hypothetical protein SDC9_55903 [bioreactor metagenome]|uniref:Uncharacterized protein n=1 Tax=bioreactor metagenome TaxID=1076179 RepID=A0A644X0D2_9ZZZZ